MALSVTASPDLAADRPRIRLDVTGTNVAPNAVPPSSLISLFRTHSDGRRYQVITEADARLSGTTGVWYDYHAPFGEQVTYQVAVGAVQASNVDTSGYWDYAPPPNLLPSQYASLGLGGNPTDNGWVPAYSTITVSGNDLRVTSTTTARPPYILTGQIVITDEFVKGSPATIQVKVRNNAASTMILRGALQWYSSDGVYMSEIPLGVASNGVSVGAGVVRTASATGTIPTGASRYRFLLFTDGITPPNSFQLQGLMVENGSVASPFPVAVFHDTTGSPTMLTSEVTWLVSAADPRLSCPVHAVMEIGDRSRATRAGTFQIIGRRNPIVVSDGQRAGYAGSIVVRSDSQEMDEKIDALIDSDAPILINPMPGMGRDLPRMWVQPGDVAGPRNAASWTGYQYRTFSWGFTEVDQPIVYGNALWSCQAVVDEYATCADVLAAYGTASDLALDTRAA